MANRFQKNRRRALIAGCVFCCVAGAIALSGGAQAAAIFSQISATGTDFLGGGSSLQWCISNSNNTGLPLVCGQEIVSASAVESYLSRGGKYQSAQALENADLITMQTERELAFTGAGVYDESLLYDAAGAGQPEGGCGIDGLIPATTGDTNETIPAIDPYCSAFQVETSLMGSDLQYKSIGLISSGSEEVPDSFGFQFSGTGEGFGSLSTRSMSITPYYNNHLSDRITAGGKPFTLEGKFQFTSFALTFDSPTVEG
jgi:hypothetical protein